MIPFRLKLLVVSVVISAAGTAGAETSDTLTGRVRDAETGSLLSGVTVVIQGNARGTVTDDDGLFMFTDVPPGVYAVTAGHIGYRKKTVHDIRTGDPPADIRLPPSPVILQGIDVTGQAADDPYNAVGVLGLDPRQTRTLAGAAEDPLRALQAFPGVLSPNDFSSQMIVRGSGPDENLILLDDIEIYNPYRLYGMISVFNPEAVSSITLTSAGFPARYGDRLSAVLDVRSRTGDRTRAIGGSLNASITNANLFLSGGSERLRLSYSLSARRTYYDLILGPIARNSGHVQGDVAFPNFSDIQGNIVFDPSPDHRLTLTALAGRDAVRLISGEERATPDSLSVRDDTRNEAVGLTWRYLPGKDLLSSLTVSYYRNRGNGDFTGSFLDPSLNRELYGADDTIGVRFSDAAFTSRYSISRMSVMERFTLALPAHAMEAGVGLDHIRSAFEWRYTPDETFRAIMANRNITIPDMIDQAAGYNRYSVYVQDLMKLGDRISVNPGIRYDYFTVVGKGVWQPRVSVEVMPGELTSLHASTGIYYQSPGYERLRDQEILYDFTDPSIAGLRPERAIHYVLGIDQWLDHEWQLGVESYLKIFDDLLAPSVVEGTVYETGLLPGGDPGSINSWETPVAVRGDSVTAVPENEGRGRSYGLEVLLRKANEGPGGRLSGWISYAVARAERTERGVSFPFSYDQRHTVNVVIDYRLSGWLSLGIRWRYGTNFPYTPPVGIAPRIVEVTENGATHAVIQTDDGGNVVFDLDRGGTGNRGSGRLPPYHRLDLRLTAGADYWDLDWTFYLDVINVYNHQNILAYQFYVNDDLTIGRNILSMLPILPTLGFSVRF